ncbi:MAG TPA: LacI family DNA-binding transcriptional regulator [Terriglobales bacterium]|nr:LacI family DNA-binding transcriptional regulator [Terriglobales bacterium]
MSKKKARQRARVSIGAAKPTLKQLAERVGLSQTTVSLVMNGAEAAIGISADTRERILAAAREINYRPSFLARSLRTGRSYMIGVMVPAITEGYNVGVLGGIEEHLVKAGYLHITVSHHFRSELVQRYSATFLDRSVDGVISACGPWDTELPVPAVTISSYPSTKNTPSVILDHQAAAELGMRHLYDLGHRKIAVMKGVDFVPDAKIRWETIKQFASTLGVAISPKLAMPIEASQFPNTTPRNGYTATKKLLASGEPFTAIFAFNDVSAISAMRALSEAGLRVPEDISVIGFDDIESAAYQTLGLTTIRQPLRKMGSIAAETLIRRIEASKAELEGIPIKIVVAPELVVRETSGPARTVNTKQRFRRG